MHLCPLHEAGHCPRQTANRASSGLSQQHSPRVSDVVTWQCMPYNLSAVSTPSLPSHLHPLPTTAPLRFQPAVRRLSLPTCRKDSQSAQSLPMPAQACQGYSEGKPSVRHWQAVLRLTEGRMLAPVFPSGFPWLLLLSSSQGFISVLPAIPPLPPDFGQSREAHTTRSSPALWIDSMACH